MSYHVLHVLRHGALLSKSQGFIVCRDKDEITGRVALSDIRAVVIAARGVLLSSSVISALLENDAVILHCDSKYQPCGVSAALPRTVNLKAASSQEIGRAHV